MSRGPHTNWWSEYDDIFLRDNWDKMSASKIGLALGDRSKNSVIGRAHRLGLTPKAELRSTDKVLLNDRQSILKRDYARRRREAKKAGIVWVPRPKGPRRSTLSAIDALKAIAEEPFKHEVEPMPMRPANPAPPPLRRQPLPPATPRVAEKETAVWDNHSCCWPIGDPGTRDFKFCDDPVVYGQSYCSKHRKIAYVPKQRERVW